jgi:hypothetical protein
MIQFHLKKIRVIFALIFFLLIVFLLIDFRKLLPEAFYDSILYLQFVPSLLKFISAVSIATLGFLAVIILTALFVLFCNLSAGNITGLYPVDQKKS